MPATARQFDIPEADLNSAGGGGAYAELDVPGDYKVTLVDVEDYDKRSEGKSFGWVWTYEVGTPSGNTLLFRTWTSFSPAARWKLIEVLEAHGVDIEAGINDVDPNEFIGDLVGATIDFPRDKNDEPTSDFRELRSIFALEDAPVPSPVAEEPTVF